MARKATKDPKNLRKGLFNNIRINFQMSVIEVWLQAWQPGQRIANGPCKWRFARDSGQLGTQPIGQIIEDGSGLGSPDGLAPVRWLSPSFFLNGIEIGNPPYGLLGDG